MCSAHCQLVFRHIWTPTLKTRSLRRNQVIQNNVGTGCITKYLSSGEAFTALKPFFFAVHPDLFGQFPKERAVNENSLKQLNAYIESATLDKPLMSTHLKFYIRENTATLSPAVKTIKDGKFPSVNIVLGHRDVRMTVHSILAKCNLPTAYVDNIPATAVNKSYQPYMSNRYEARGRSQRPANADMKDVENDIFKKNNAPDSLRIWLERNVVGARDKLQDCWPIRDEIVRLKQNICDTVGVKDVLWDCGWGMRHFRGCMLSFLALAAHHPEIMDILKDKVVIFGRDTGVSLDGHVILNSSDVRANWHDLIKRVDTHNSLILRLPSVELALSQAIKNINVVHRKFEPTRMADSYELHLRKLITSIGDYRGRCNFPKLWPESLAHLELVVETDSGPLMVSPTGQIIVPSSCPPFLLVNFITEHMEEASQKLAQYQKQKYEEKDLHSKCVEQLGLFALEKADNVTPNLMIDCLSRLLSRAEEFKPILRGSHLWVTTYYSVLSDGEMCVPWNWK